MINKNTDSFLKKSNKDRYIVALSLLGLLLCAIPLASDSVFTKFFGIKEKLSHQPSLGQITFAVNDIRHKNSQSFMWQKASPAQTIHLGDSVFTRRKVFFTSHLKKMAVV